MSREHPALAIGLHWHVSSEDERDFDTHDLRAVRDEFQRQLDAPTAMAMLSAVDRCIASPTTLIIAPRLSTIGRADWILAEPHRRPCLMSHS